ncbi:MAG: hypothetical protein ACJAQ0_001328 [Dasania sp.]|jgi:hypothetical protein
MTQHITIGFNKPQAMIAILLTRFDLSNHGIHITPDNPNIMVRIFDHHLQINQIKMPYPILFSDFMTTIRNTTQTIN